MRNLATIVGTLYFLVIFFLGLPIRKIGENTRLVRRPAVLFSELRKDKKLSRFRLPSESLSLSLAVLHTWNWLEMTGYSFYINYLSEVFFQSTVTFLYIQAHIRNLTLVLQQLLLLLGMTETLISLFFYWHKSCQYQLASILVML